MLALLIPGVGMGGGGSADVTVSLTGVSLGFSAGTLGVTHTQALTGSVATFSAGTLATTRSRALTGSAATLSTGTLTPAVDRALSGENLTFSTGDLSALAGGDKTVALTGIDLGFFTGTLTAQGADQPVSEERPAGGWLFFNQYEAELARRRRLKKEREALEQETERIEDPASREIAGYLREQEAKDERRAELERLRSIAREHASVEDMRAYNARVAAALERALAKATYSTAEALERELERARTEEEMALLVKFIMLYENDD